MLQDLKFNHKQVKWKAVKVCITWKVVGFLEFYIFPGYKNNMLLVIQFTGNTFTYLVHNSVFSEKVFHWELL